MTEFFKMDFVCQLPILQLLEKARSLERWMFEVPGNIWGSVPAHCFILKRLESLGEVGYYGETLPWWRRKTNRRPTNQLTWCQSRFRKIHASLWNPLILSYHCDTVENVQWVMGFYLRSLDTFMISEPRGTGSILFLLWKL